MKISELVDTLEKLKAESGDIKVNVANGSGYLVDLKPSGVLVVMWPEDRKTVYICSQ